jgi:hypothetical protein
MRWLAACRGLTGNHADLNSGLMAKSLSVRECGTGFRSTSCRCGGGFAKQVAGNVEKAEAPTLLRELFEIRLDENLDGLFAGINLDTNRRIAEIDLVASSVCSANDGVGHYRLASQGVSGDIRPPSTGPGPKSRAIMVWNGAGRWINVGNRSEPSSIT